MKHIRILYRYIYILRVQSKSAPSTHMVVSLPAIMHSDKDARRIYISREKIHSTTITSGLINPRRKIISENYDFYSRDLAAATLQLPEYKIIIIRHHTHTHDIL